MSLVTFLISTYVFTCITDLAYAHNAEIVIRPNQTTGADNGNTITFVCVAYGIPDPSISWNRGDTTLSNGSRVTIYEELLTDNGVTFVQSILELCSSEVEDAGQYSCFAENTLGNDTAAFVLTVNGPPQILISPGNFTVEAGSTITLSCAGFGDPTPSIAWSMGTTQLSNNTQITVYEEVLTEVGVNFVHSILEICSIEEANGGVYTCTVGNAISNTSYSFELSIIAAAEIMVRPNQTIGADNGNTITFVCVAYGIPDPSISWNRGDTTLSNGSRVTIYEELLTDNGVTFVQSILELCSAEVEDAGEYSCFAENTLGNDTAAFVLTVNGPPQILISPGNFTVEAGSTITLSCAGFGDPTPSIAWSMGATQLSNNTQITIYEELLTEVGVNFVHSILEICSIEEANGGVYTCTVGNAIGNTSYSFELSIIAAAEIMVRPNQTIGADNGNTVTFVCVAYGIPDPSISWNRGDTTLSNGSRVTIYEELLTDNGVTFVQSILELCSAEVEDAGEYSCFAENTLGNDTAAFVLTVNGPPQILISPGNSTVEAGSTITLSCAGFGDPTPSIAWSMGATQLSNNTQITIYEELLTEVGVNFVHSILEICIVEEANGGVYTCTVGNAIGNTSYSFELSIIAAAEIMVRPNQTIGANNGNTITFVCVAYGIPDPSISWNRGDTTLSNGSRVTIYEELLTDNGVTFVQSILELCSAEVEDAGEYSCFAENTLGNDTAAFVLTVNGPPQILISPGNFTVEAGSTITLSCAGFGDPTPSIAWSMGATQLSNNTQITIYEELLTEVGVNFVHSILEICSIEEANGGVYTCTVGNAIGNTSYSFELSVTTAAVIVVRPNQTTSAGVGNTITFVCVAYGIPDPSISWKRENSALNNGSQIIIYEVLLPLDGVKYVQSILELCSVEEEDAGQYSCLAENSIGNDTAAFALTVNAPPQIVLSPGNSSVEAGSTVILSCAGFGVPIPSVTWSMGSTELSNSSQIAIYTQVVTEVGVDFVHSILEICNVDEATSGEYSCTVGNVFGDTSFSFGIGVRPEIVIQPPNTSVNLGSAVLLTCVSYGLPIPTITWNRGDAKLNNDSRTTVYDQLVTENGVTFIVSMLQLCSAEEMDNGEYSCIGQNLVGIDSSVFQLRVCMHGAVRLDGGAYSFEGRVEVCVNGVWGTVCNDSWSSVDASIACKYLGYSTYDVEAINNISFGETQLPILLDDVSCTGSESRLLDCPYNSNTSDCSHSQDAGTRCHPIPTSVSLNTPVTGTTNNGEVKYYNFPFHSSGITFRLDVLQGSVDAYASYITDAPNLQRGYNWTVQNVTYDDVFFSPAPEDTVYIALQGIQSSNSFRVGAVAQNVTTTALTALSPLFDTLSSGVTKYYEVAFPSDGVTITLDVTQGSVTLYASDNIWNTNAQDYDWTVTANTTSGFIEAFFNSSTLNRQVRSILFLAIVGEQNTSTYIMNNAVGDIRTTVPLAPSNPHVTEVDATSATVVWTVPPPNVNSPLSSITSYQLVLSQQQFNFSSIEVDTPVNTYTFTGLEQYNRYNCTIAATNGVGQGPYSAVIVFNTSQAAPSAPPQGFSGFNQSSTSISLSWSPPPAIDINGAIQYYTVEVNEVRTGRSFTFHTSTNITIRALHPYYVYRCQVAAYTVALGPFANNLWIVTGEDDPTAPPANLTVTSVTSRTATLSWDPPPYEEQNGVIREYMLTVNRSDTSFFIVLNTTMTQLTVEHLLPFRTYLFTVAAQTIELGPFTMVEEIQLPEDEPDAPPQNLNGSAINSTSLFLSWELPPSEQQNGIIRRYLVNVSEVETGNGIELSTTDTNIIVSDLHSFYHYDCNVSAVTIGVGPYTLPITIQTLQAAPSGPPQNFQSSEVSSRSITFTWDPPLFEEQNGVITGYIINVTSIETEELFELFSDSESLTADFVRPFSSYIFKIAGQTAVGTGTFSDPITIMTPEDVPSEPLNPDVLSIAGSPTELLVTWDPPAEPNGVILSYTVYCYDLPMEEYQLLSNVTITSQPEHKEIPGNETEIILVNLTPYYLYGCLVTANTSVGEGNASSIHFNITDESVPADPPANFSAAAINATAIELTWSQPPTPNGIVIFYNITYNLSEMILESSFSVLKSVLVDAEDGNSYVVTGLNEYTAYEFEIFASTRIGPGPSTQATARTHHTNPHAPPQNIQSRVTGSKMAVISWDPPPFDDHNGVITYYLLLITQEQFNISDMVINTTSDVTNYTVTGLQEYNNYTCRVAAATRIGPGPYSAPIRFSTPQDAPSAAPQSVFGTPEGSRAIMLMWSPPPAIHINGIIEKYVVYVTENETSQMWTFITTADTRYIVVGSLHPHYHYDCRVVAFTIAEGTLSSVVTVQTEQEPPSAPPSPPVVFGTTHNSLSLNWQAPPFEETNGAIRSYVIAIHEVETGRNFTATSNTTQVTLEPLHPYYTYMCSIAAETVGRGPLSEHITVQLPEAAPASPPTNVTGRATDSTAIVLSWSPPPPGNQNGIIRSYNISVLEQDTGREFSRTSVNTEESFHSLHPFYIYSVTITATTVAPGPPSTPIMVQTEEDIPSASPGNITVVEITSHSVSLMWIPPAQEYQNGIIIGYVINVTVEETGEMYQLYSSTTNITATLIPFTTYTIVITAENSVGTGPYTEVLNIQSEEAAPIDAPQNLTVTALSPHSITLHWSPPPPHSQNGVIREYRVNVTEVETGMEFNFTTSATSITVPFLHPYYTYECVISAYTVATGPYAEVTVMTPEDVPSGSPQNITAIDILSRFATLKWGPPHPEDQNGNITAYVINASIVGSEEMFQFVSQSTILEIDTLTPYTTYSILIAASTSVGSGPFSTVLTIQTPEDVPTSPPLNPTGVADTSRSLSLSWDPPPPGDQHGMLRHYIVNITEVETGRTIQHTTQGPTPSVHVPLLHPYYTYQWRVSAYTVGEGPYTNVSTLHTPEDEPSAAPQSFTAHFNATSHDSIFLSWDPLPTEDQNGIILGYLINITDISREDTLQFSSDTHNLTIESLRPHTTYTCLVAAYTSVGMGPFSVEISVQTLETSPGGTAINTTGVALNSTHIYLSWDHPHEDLHHGVIRYYQLNITEQDTGRVFQLTSEDTEITIGPLHPHYIYHCAISAVTVDEGPYITITVITDEDAPSGPPTNFQVRADSSRSLVLSWDPPLPHHQNGIVRMYTVSIALNNSVQLTNISTTANSARITALIRPFRAYKCSVGAETVAVGPATENIIVTPEDIPETAPLNLSVQATDSQTLVLSWEPPLPEDRNGIIINYTVNITEIETGTQFQLVTDNTTITAFSLHPYYTYSYTVAAETSVGLGPYTSPRAVQMPEDAPSAAPVSVISSMVNSSGFTLMWDAPPAEEQNGVIRYYAIHIIEINTSQEYALNSTENQTALYFLHPYYNYTYAVSAVTIELGPFSNATNIQTSQNAPTGPPLDVDATPVNSTSVTISWNPPAPENQNGVITGYVINLTLTVGTGDVSQYSSSSDNITIGTLHPFTAYAFTVAAQTSVGTGPYTISSTVMTPEDAPSAPPVAVRHTQLTSTSIILQWTPPPTENVNGIIRAYTLTVSEHETRLSYNLSSPQTELSVGNLHPFYWYNFSVCAVTIAQGPCTAMHTLQTLEAVPGGPPLSFQATHINSSALQLTWEPPAADLQNGIIRQYVVNATELESGQHFQWRSPSTISLIVGRLHPYYNYHLFIRAETIGPGPFSDVFPIMMPEDAPSGGPTNVHLAMHSSGSVFLTWQPPPLSQQNGIISGYTILLTALQDGSSHVYNLPATASSHHFEGLHLFGDFQVAVAAQTVAGTGPYSIAPNLTTPINLPGAPGDITYQILTDTVIQFSWSPPDSPNDVINGYQVIYRGYSVNQTVDGLIIGTAGNIGGSAVLNVTEPPAIIRNLIPGLTYEFKLSVTCSTATFVYCKQWKAGRGMGTTLEGRQIRARTAVGYGHNSSTVIVQLRVDEVPLQPIQDIDIRMVFIACGSIVAVIIWIGLCCLCTCVIVYKRNKSKERLKAVEYNLPVLTHEQRFDYFENLNVDDEDEGVWTQEDFF